MFHKMLIRIIKSQRKHKFELMNSFPQVGGNCILAVNHSCKWDAQYMMELAPAQTYLLVGSQSLELIDRIGIIWNGAVWVDRKSKTSKAKSKKKLRKLLDKGKNICIFPEGTWNLTPSKPMLPLYWGVIELAKMSKVPIIPVCLEYQADICWVQFAEPIYIDIEADNGEEISKLRDVLATLKWKIWETFPQEHRSQLEPRYWGNYVRHRLDEYKKLDYDYEMSCVRD